MSIRYKTEARKDYLIVRAEGATDNPQELLEFVQALLKEAESHDLDRFLLDNRDLRFKRNHIGTYDAAVRCVDLLNQAKPLKVAMLSRPERLEYAKVYETIALTGRVDIKVFVKQNMAIAWLTA